MTIETQCSGCGRKLRVADEHAGRAAACPECGVSTPIPSDAEPLPVEPAIWRMKTPEGKVYGPITETEMKDWVNQGRVDAACTLSDDGEQWRPAGEVFDQLNPVEAVPQQASYYARSPVVVMRPHRGGMILTLGILSWIVACPIFSIMAWVMGTADLREMSHGQMDDEGMGVTQAGQVLGLLNALVWILAGVIGTVLLLVAIAK
ncbi:MAG: hypothetical protein QGG36_01385 [Pirellulaceae bacterium]|jgi:hypothetical protein|nr:hypothetical protein [Pirellulaceae bacterium]MDP7014431.1 hypothetical protein [Pirellulaceae bacterium]